LGRIRDKHGRLNWYDEYKTPGVSGGVCPQCGVKANDMDTHNACFHPQYRDGEKAGKSGKPVDPAQQSLEFQPKKEKEKIKETILILSEAGKL